MGIKISDMDADAAITGVELLAVSDGGVTKSATTLKVANFIIDQIETIGALGAVDGNDSVLMLENGSTLKPTDIDLIKQYVIDAVWAADDDAAPDDADLLALLDGGTTEKTVTLANLAAYVLATIEAALINVSDVADGSGAIGANDYMLVTQGTTGKRIQISDLRTLILAYLPTHIAALGAAADPAADADLYLTFQGGVAKKITLAKILEHYGPTIDGSGTADTLAYWTDADTLQAGPTIGEEVDGFTEGSDSVLPTTALVRHELDELITDHTDIGAPLVDADTLLVDDGGGGTQKKSEMSRLYTYTIESIIPAAVDGTLATGDNDLTPTKLVYAKTCSDNDVDDIITVRDGAALGQIVTIYLIAKTGADNAIVTPETALGWADILLDTVDEIATLQWHGAAVGWVILYTNGGIDI